MLQAPAESGARGVLLQADPAAWFDSGDGLVDLLATPAITAIITLVLCAIYVWGATAYTGRTTTRIHRQPGRTFAYGFGFLVAFVVLFVALFITFIGIFIAIPLALLFALGFIVWGQLGYLAVARFVTDEKWQVVAVATGVSFLAAVTPTVGTLAGVVIGSLGVGSAYLEFRGDGRPSPRRRRNDSRRPRGRRARSRGRRSRSRRDRRRPAEDSTHTREEKSWGRETDWGFKNEQREDSWGFDDDESWRTSSEESQWNTEDDEDSRW